MTMNLDTSAAMLEQVNQALSDNLPLRIQGSNSKSMLGQQISGEVLDTRGHRGIVSYDPTELIVTARCGTPLQEVVDTLEASGQMLPCEPPQFGANATFGGMVAAGLSGPRRPWAGSVRDFVLGTRVITGHGKHLKFGAEVMKNVAGYDVSRMMAGSYGCLGVLTEISMKVLPRSRACMSLRLEMDQQRALNELAAWGQQPIPISAAAYDKGALYLRLEGGTGSVQSAKERLGGDDVSNDFWLALREHRLDFFSRPETLWRLSVPAVTPVIELPGQQIFDWGGAQRWLKSDADADHIRQVVSRAQGHATCYGAGVDTFHPLSDVLRLYHSRIKAQLDPQGIFNPGRLYADL